MQISTKIHGVSSEDVISEILGLGQLCHGAEDIRKVLDLLVEKISKIMQSDVCSLYLLDPHSNEISLKATKGLKIDAVGKVKMPVGEGLVGKTIGEMKPVVVSSARKSKKFKFFPETGEEKYSSFLSVPLIYNRNPIGALVVQNKEPIRYSSRSIHLLMTLSIPAVGVIEKAKLSGTFGKISKGEGPKVKEKDQLVGIRKSEGMVHTGISASPGIAICRVKILRKDSSQVLPARPSVPIHADVEKMRVLEAFRWVEEETLAAQKEAKKKFGMEELSIFDAYKMVLESAPFKEQILSEIDRGNSALKGVESVILKYAEELSLADDDYIRERIYDIQDVGRKITDRLLYGSDIPVSHHHLKEEAILLSDFWSISDFVEMDLEKTKGILSPGGGASSHIAILAKSLGIPAVLGLSNFADMIHEGDNIIMDGSSGVVILNPTKDVLNTYKRESRHAVETQRKYKRSARHPAIPKGGRKVFMGANMGIVAHVNEALENGAEEIGLYRTEFPFLIRRSLPTEEEQYSLYKKILSSMGKRPINIRTLDIGGDKYVPYLNLPNEKNPFLGWRSIRISLEREDLFRIQLRALLRASTAGKLRILFPMISSVEEIRRVKEILEDVKQELHSKRIPYASNLPIGIMIEVPSSVEIADSLIKEVNFFSIGTNDLVQYTLAVDRNNAKVANLYNPLHPAVLRLIRRTVKVAHKHKKHVSVCGEMAEQPVAVALLVGMGVDGLSMSVPLISKIKSFISRLNSARVKKLTSDVLKMDSAGEISAEVERYLRKNGLDEFLPHKTPVNL